MPRTIIRPLEKGETSLFLSYAFPRVPELWETDRDYEALLATSQYRPEHSWVAIEDDVVVARACWWTGSDDTEPQALDWLEAMPGDRQVELGTSLLEAAHVAFARNNTRRPDYHLLLPPNWRQTERIRLAAEARLQSAQNAGLTLAVERHSYRWSADRDGLPPRGDRLQFVSATDQQVLSVLREILSGSLDANDRRTVEGLGLDGAAAEQLDGLKWFPSPRDWWKLAYTKGDELVGAIFPARNYSRPVIGYIGVVPEKRGQGFVDELLSEMMYFLAQAAPGEEVGADTDFLNKPMATAFARGGFRKTQDRLVLSDSSGLTT